MLAAGVVAETGTFTELVAKRGGAFFALAKSHLGGSHDDDALARGGDSPAAGAAAAGRPPGPSPQDGDTALHTTIELREGDKQQV
jgi:hypothetical protein